MRTRSSTNPESGSVFLTIRPGSEFHQGTDGRFASDGSLFLLVGICFGLLWIVVYLRNPYDVPNGQLFWSILVGFAGSLPLLKAIFPFRLTKLPFFQFHLFFFSIEYGFAGIAPYFTPRIPFDASYVDRCLILFLIYVVSSCIAYYGILPKQPPRLRMHGFSRLPLPAPIHITIAGFLLLVISTMVPIAARQVTTTLENAVVCIAFFHISNPHLAFTKKLLLALYLLALSVKLLLTGLLANNMVLGVAFFCAWAWTNRKQTLGRRCVIPVIALATSVTFILITNPIKTEYRRIAWHNNKGGISGLFEIAFSLYKDQKDFIFTLPYMDNSVSLLCRRMSTIPVLAGAMVQTPKSIPFKNGSTLVGIFIKIIPRAIWPGKPQETTGNDWGREYGFLDSTDNLTSFNQPLIVEGYINRGTFGVAMMGILVGLIFGVASYFEQYASSTLLKALYLTVMYSVLFPESNFTSIFGGIIISLIVVYLALKAYEPFCTKPEAIRAKRLRHPRSRIHP